MYTVDSLLLEIQKSGGCPKCPVGIQNCKLMKVDIESSLCKSIISKYIEDAQVCRYIKKCPPAQYLICDGFRFECERYEPTEEITLIKNQEEADCNG